MSARTNGDAPRGGDLLLGLTPEELQARLTRSGLPRFAATQVQDWVFRKGVFDYAAMTNLPRAARERLAEELPVLTGTMLTEQEATDGTRKLLVEWPDPKAPPPPANPASDDGGDVALPLATVPGGAGSGLETECVMIPTEKRRTACISSQVGCPVGCRFCASGLGGLDGNLPAARIVEQVLRLQALPGMERITNIVFMGMGEPLSNFGNVTRAIRVLNAPWGCGIGARRITVSTVGLPAAIRRLAKFELPVTLALSLHAPNDEIRRQLIPWAEYATIDELVDACDEYFQRSGREITLEYLLLRRVNDRPEHARELADVCRRLRANVNLIRYNEVRGLPYDRPTTDDVRTFQDILRERGVNVHIRASRGRDIAAACGQLRHEKREAARGG